MISGYFYKKENAGKRIKKIAILFIEANVLYCMWSYFISGTFPVLELDTVLKFLSLNVSPFGYHLWYLGAIIYILIAVYFLDRIGKRKVLYYFIPLFLIIDLMLGKYSLFFFRREFPYIWVRNWVFTGIPFFSIGMLMRDKPKFRIKWYGIPVLIVTTIIERFILVSNDLNATRDQYISTTLLAIAVFSFALDYKGKVNETLAKMGQECSTWIYIIHPIFITIYDYMIEKIGLQSTWKDLGAIVVFFTSLISVYAVNVLTNSFRCRKKRLQNPR